MENEKLMLSVIVAMKGPPCSGKTTLSRTIAKTLKYLLITQEDCIAELKESPPNYFTTSTAEAFNDLSFNIICQIASTQLNLGHRVIIDSSVYCQAHIDTLLKLSASTGARLIIVECQPRDKYEWQQRLIQRGEDREWEDLDRLLELHNGCSISRDHVGEVSKLLVDTTHHIRDWDLTSGVKYLASCQDNESMDLHDWANDTWIGVRGDLWKQNTDEEKDNAGTIEVDESGHFHRLILVEDKHSNKQNSCGGCLQVISNPTYYKCGECDLSIHTSCAELPEKREISPNDYPAFLRELQHQYSFPEVQKCSILDHEDHEGHEDFSKCRSCLFETHLRCALLPSIIPPKCHEHALYITIYPLSIEFGFRCQVCGDPGEHLAYTCIECPFICHLQCAMLPYTSSHKSHRHPLTLTSPTSVQEDDFVDFVCDACEEKRNSTCWTYYCTECGESGREFACHLKCMSFGPE